jgi:hypothetical protein
MDGTTIVLRTLEPKFKEMPSVGRSEQNGLARYWKTPQRMVKSSYFVVNSDIKGAKFS